MKRQKELFKYILIKEMSLCVDYSREIAAAGLSFLLYCSFAAATTAAVLLTTAALTALTTVLAIITTTAAANQTRYTENLRLMTEVFA